MNTRSLMVKITFELLESVSRTGTNHEEDQPCHLKLKQPAESAQLSINFYRSTEALNRNSALPAFTSTLMSKREKMGKRRKSSRLMHKIVFIVRLVISKIHRKILIGQFLKVVVVHNTRTHNKLVVYIV